MKKKILAMVEKQQKEDNLLKGVGIGMIGSGEIIAVYLGNAYIAVGLGLVLAMALYNSRALNTKPLEKNP